MSYQMHLEGALAIEPALTTDDLEAFRVFYTGGCWSLDRDGKLTPSADNPRGEPIDEIGVLITDFFEPRRYALRGRLLWKGEDGNHGSVDIKDREIRVDASSELDPSDLSEQLLVSLECDNLDRRLLALDTITQDFEHLSDGVRFLPHIIAFVEDRDLNLRLAAITALGQFRSFQSRVVPILIMALTDPVPWVRAAASESLGSFGEAAREALPALEDLTRDREDEPRERALEAIALIQRGCVA